MEDSLNKSSGDNLIDLKLNEDLNVSPDTDSSEQGLLVSDSFKQEDPKSKQKGNPPSSEIPKKTVPKVISKVLPKVEPKVEASEGLLDNIGSQIHNETEGVQPKIINKDLSYAAKELNQQIGYVSDLSNLDRQVADAQSNWKQAGNAIARVALKILPEVASQLANALDIEDYLNSDDEVGNWVAKAVTKGQQSIDKEFPIYRENPNKPLDITDPAYIFQSFESLATSIGGFAGAGFITAGLIDFATLRGAKALSTLGKLAQGVETGGELSATAQRIRSGVNTVAQAAMLNQAESVGIGVDTYNISYKRALEKLQADPSNIEKSKEELSNKAKFIASNDASSAIAFNRITFLLNLSSANLFFKSPVSTRLLLDKGSLLGTGKRVAIEGFEEGLEENINDQAQNQALDKNYSFMDGLKYSFTAKGLESSILGMIGGVGNTVLTEAGKFIPNQDNNIYRETYVNEYDKAKRSGLTEEEADVKAQQIAIEKAGTNKSSISEKQKHNQRYVKQQDNQVSYNERLTNDNISDAILNLSNTADITELHKELDNSIKSGDKVKSDVLESILVGRMAQNAFDTGTTEGLIGLFDGYANLTHEQATDRNMYKKGDENTPNYYKTKAKDVKDRIEKLENIYNTSKKYLNNQEVYDLQERKLALDNTLEKNYKAINAKFAEAEKTYKDDKIKHPSFNKTYVDLESPSGFDINKVVPAFRQTDEYKDIKNLNNTSKDLLKLKEEYQKTINEITSKKYQENLKDVILKHRETEKREENNTKKEKAVNETKKTNLDKIKALKEELVDKFSNSTVDTNELREKNLPIVENEGQTESTTSKPKDINTESAKDTPRFVNFSKYDVQVDNVLNNLKNNLSSGERTTEENYKEASDIYNKMSSAKEGVLSSYPLKAKEYNQDIDTLKNLLEDLKVDLDIKNNNVIKLKQNQQQLVNSLNGEEEDSSDNTTDASPKTNIDFAKSKKESDLMFSVLNDMQNLGIDINDFKSILTSFEQNTSKDDVVRAFTKLKGLYIASTGNDVDGTYEDLMYTDKEKNQLVNDFDFVRKFSIPEDRYISELDPTTKDVINLHKELAKLSDTNVDDTALGYEIYNDSVSNLLAYLSKKYELKFTEKQSETGKPYIMVTKEDIDNFMNPNLDERVLNPDFIKVGDKIKLVPLKSVVLEDGTIFNTDTLKEEDKISKIPIGIEINGEVIKGLYLHNTDWINMTNTDLTANQVIKEQNKSNLVRQIIINNGGIETSITHKTPGVPIVNTDDGLHTVLEQTPNVEIGISKIGTIYSSEQKETKVSNIDNIKEGQQVIIIPFGKSKIALPVSRAKLTTNYINSITTAVSLYLDGKETDLTKELKTYGYDILNSKGLENYLHNFINVSNSLNAKTFEGFQDRIKGVDDAVGIISMVNSSLMFGRGTGIRVNNISKNKYNDELGKPLSDKDERINTDLQTLSKHLSSTYVNINLNSLGKEIKIPIINEEGKIEIEHNNYNDFAKANMYSKYMSIKVDDVDVYTIQGKISYDIDSIIKNSKSEELVDSVNEGSKEEIILNEANKLVTEIVNKGKKEKNFKPITKEDRKNKIDYDLLFNDMFKDISKVLNVNEKDIKNTKDILKEYLKEIHPDKVKGEFNKELSNIFTIAMINVANENNIEKLKELYFKYKDILNNYKYNNPENNKPKQKSETIILPSGKTFNPDDVNIDDFSPLTLEDKVNYNLKSFDILSSDKAKEIFAKGEKNNWDLDKILTELQIPKEQKELILNNGKTNLDDIVTDLLSNYSYTVEINTSISKNHTKGILDEESYNNLSIEKQKEYDDEFLNKPTQHYSNLTVPGGTNYTENEIATSAITPSIKGHAQFSTDNGIGWFRSDDKAKNIEDTNALEDKLQNAWNNGELEYGTRPSGGTFVKDANSIESSKIRRILEVQSDLFQKGRNKENLDQNRIERKSPNVNEINFPPGDTDKILQNTNENQFLQLLNKDNNWVTFFVKSIIQDSAKKGYEKVLFPSGNTAAKVEGHETVQGFIDNKESRINELIRRKNSKQEELLSTNVIESDKNILQRELKGIKNEVQQLEKEIEDAKAGKLKISSIANFYEETIFNVLKKQGYNPTTISDEYGNGWNEIELTPETLSTINLSPITEENHDYLLENSSFIKGLSIGTQTSIIKTIANDIYNEFLENTDKSSFVFDVKKQVDLAIQGFDLIKNNYINKEDARAEFVANQVDIIIENKEKILNSVRAILTPKIKRVSNVNYNDEVEVENTLENEEQENIKIFSDKSEYIIDPRTKLSEEVKQFLEGVVQRKVIDLGEVKDYVPITNPLGLNNFISSDVVFNDIMSLSAKSNSNNGFNSKSNYIDERFNSKMLTDVPSYVRNFVINLAKNIDSKPYLFGIIQKVLSAKPHLQNAIVSTFNKAHTHHIFLQSSYNAIDKKWSITKNVAASRSVSALIKTQWLNNISYSDIVSNNDKGKVINKEAIDKFKTDYNNLASGKEILSPKSLNNLLNQIGITIPLPLFNVLNSGKFKEDNKEQTLLQSFNLSNGMFKNIYNRVMQFDSSNSDALTLDGNNVFDETGFTSLAKLVGRYTDNLFNSNFKNGNGDTVYGFSNDRYVISRQIDLKTDINLLSRLSTSVFSTGSEWLKGLLDTSDDIPRINRNSYMYQFFEYYTSDSLKTKNNALGKTINELSADELEKYSFGLFMNNGKYAGKGLSKVPIITVLYPTMEEKSNMFGLQVPGKHYELEEGKLKNQDVKDLVRQLFYPEISRIRAFNQNPNRVNVKEYKQGGHMFLMFPALNYIHDLYEGRELNEDESVKEFGILKQTFNAIEENLLEKQLVNYFRSEAIKRKDNWIKYKILGGEETKGNLHLNYIDENYARNFDTNNLKQVIYNYNINSIVANVNIQQLFLGDVVSYTKIKKGTSKNDFLRIASNTSDNETKRLAVDNASANEILHEPDETFNLLVSNDVITESKVLPYLKELWEGHRLYNNVIDAYSNINSTDAQELTTLSEHVNMLFKEGKITEQQKNSVLEEYENTGRISNQNKQLILQPYKLRYGNNINRNGEDLRLNIKSSSFPLIKQLTENTDLDGLRIHMEENNIHRLAFASAVKIGQPLELVTLFDDNGQFIKPNNIELGLIRNVPRKGHGNQQENPYNEDTNQVIDGSQQSKEIFTNILHIEGFKHPISGEDVNAKELSRLYHNTYNKLFKSKYEDLVKKLDYNEETGSIKNLNYLQNELKKEGINRNYNTNDIEGLELNKSDTNFNVSLWLNASGIKIESLLSSIVDNKVRKRLFRGKSLIMASGVGSKVQTLNTIDKSNVIPIGNWDGTLKSSYNDNGEMTYAEVLAPFKFCDNNNKALKLQDFLNSAK